MSETSRQKAINSARELFIKNGRDGASMQEIADHAGINKGLLHYYFKSKKRLFHEVFRSEFNSVYADVNKILNNPGTMEEKLAGIIDRYFELLSENPELPAFVMFEVNKSPQLVKEMAEEIQLHQTIVSLDEEFRKNKISSSPEFAFQVLLNIISLCVFPFMMKPMVKEMGAKEGIDFNAMMEYRKQFLKHVIINSFRP